MISFRLNQSDKVYIMLHYITLLRLRQQKGTNAAKCGMSVVLATKNAQSMKLRTKNTVSFVAKQTSSCPIRKHVKKESAFLQKEKAHLSDR